MATHWNIFAVLTLALFVQVFAQQKRKMGGWHDVGEENSGVQNALRFAQEEYNSKSNDGHIISIDKTIRLMRQVVSGMKYKMEVEVTMSSCKNSETEQCLDETQQKKRCKFEVLIVTWQNVKELWNSSCN